MSVQVKKENMEEYKKECEKINAKKSEKLKSVIQEELLVVQNKYAEKKATHYVKEQKIKQKYFEKYHFKLFKPPSYGLKMGIQFN